MITARDFETRYGSVIDLDDLATLLSASRRAIRALLRSHGIEPVAIGTRWVVPAARVARVLGLEEAEAEVVEAARIRREMSTTADGRRKGVREYLANQANPEHGPAVSR